MTRPEASSVKSWRVVYDSELVRVKTGTAQFYEDYWQVWDKNTGKKRNYYGETAWSDAAREASDIDTWASIAI